MTELMLDYTERVSRTNYPQTIIYSILETVLSNEFISEFYPTQLLKNKQDYHYLSDKFHLGIETNIDIYIYTLDEILIEHFGEFDYKKKDLYLNQGVHVIFDYIYDLENMNWNKEFKSKYIDSNMYGKTVNKKFYNAFSMEYFKIYLIEKELYSANLSYKYTEKVLKQIQDICTEDKYLEGLYQTYIKYVYEYLGSVISFDLDKFGRKFARDSDPKFLMKAFNDLFLHPTIVEAERLIVDEVKEIVRDIKLYLNVTPHMLDSMKPIILDSIDTYINENKFTLNTYFYYSSELFVDKVRLMTYIENEFDGYLKEPYIEAVRQYFNAQLSDPSIREEMYLNCFQEPILRLMRKIDKSPKLNELKSPKIRQLCKELDILKYYKVFTGATHRNHYLDENSYNNTEQVFEVSLQKYKERLENAMNRDEKELMQRMNRFIHLIDINRTELHKERIGVSYDIEKMTVGIDIKGKKTRIYFNPQQFTLVYSNNVVYNKTPKDLVLNTKYFTVESLETILTRHIKPQQKSLNLTDKQIQIITQILLRGYSKRYRDLKIEF